jgi:MFS family permease
VSSKSQFALLRERRFAPLFWVQFLGAANDNIFKFAFTLLATYAAARWGNVDPHFAGFLIGALFIAPFMLFSAPSGQLADKLEKSWFIRRVKDAEIVVMVIGAAGLALQSAPLVYVAIFLLGLQSTVFGPVKYSYLPQHLDAHEVTGGNGMVEMGTFVAILLGTIGGGLLIGEFGDRGALVTAAVVLLVAVLGRIAAHFVPHSPAADPGLAINWNPFTETWANLKIAHGNAAVFNSIIGISWLWFFGSIFLTSFTPYARTNLGGNEAVVTFLLAVFSIGIGVGSGVREALGASGGDRTGALRIDRHDRVRNRPVLRVGRLCADDGRHAGPVPVVAGRLADRVRPGAAGAFLRPVFGAAVCVDSDARGPRTRCAHRGG